MGILLDEKKQGRVFSEKHDLRTSLCYYLSIILVLVTFIMSCVSMGLCSTSTIMDKIYTYRFPYYSKYTTIQKDMPVALDATGRVWPGAGFTVYRNSSQQKVNFDMMNVKVRQLDGDLALVAYVGGATVYQANCHGETLNIKSVEILARGKLFYVRELIAMGKNHYILIGSKYMLPLTVIVTRKNGVIDADIIQGELMSLNNNDDEYPHVDNLSDTKFAMVYERDINLYTRFGEWKGEGLSSRLELKAEFLIFYRLNFHGIAGMDESHYIVTATGSFYNMTDPWEKVVTWLVTIDRTFTTATVSDTEWLPWTESCSWFAMDNIGKNHVVLAFANKWNHGVKAVLITFHTDSNKITYGSQADFQTGGSILSYQRMDLTVLDKQRFVIMYEDAGARSLVMVLGARTYTNDLVRVSANYVIAKPGRGEQLDRFYFDSCALGPEHFIIVEVRVVNGKFVARMNLAASYSRVLGVAKRNGVITKKKDKDGNPISYVDVQMGGIVTISGKRKLTPGSALYTNSKGDLMECGPYGYKTRNFGSFYVNDKNNNLLDGKNIVGIAVTPKKIKMNLQ